MFESRLQVLRSLIKNRFFQATLFGLILAGLAISLTRVTPSKAQEPQPIDGSRLSFLVEQGFTYLLNYWRASGTIRSPELPFRITRNGSSSLNFGESGVRIFRTIKKTGGISAASDADSPIFPHCSRNPV